MAATFDIYDRATLTDLVNKPIQLQFEDQPFLGQVIAPEEDIQSRYAKLRVYETKAFGIGQFKAPDATPPLVKFDQTYREQVIELALLEEMERISGEDWILLNSTDDQIRRAAGVDLVDRGRMLQLRNERLTEWMRWQAFVNGELTITYDQGATNLYINYGIPTAHKVTAGTLWSDTTNSDPLGNIKTWVDVIADTSGFFGSKVHMSSKTWDYIVRNAGLKALLTETNRSLKVPVQGDVTALLRDGTEVIIYDNGYRNEGSTNRGRNSLTRYLPENKVLITTDYQVEGEQIADTLNGQVLFSNSYNSLGIEQGPGSEVIVDHMSLNQYFRVASARIPRILHPECFFIATVW